MRILRYILATLAVLATFTACREEDELNKAKGRVVLGEIRIEAEEANTRAIAIPTPQPKDLTIEIIDPDGYTVESGKIDHYANGIDLFVASYTLRAYYGNKQQMGNSPYFEGIAEFSISEGQTTQIGTVTAKLANAVIIPNIPTNIIDHFIGVPTFYVCKGEEKKEVTNGQALYVLPGEYTLTLEGKNKAEIEVKQTIATLNAQAQKAYNINCDLSLPNLTLPDQQAGAWAKRLYITPVITTDKNGNKIDTPKGLIYEIKGGIYTTWTAINPNIINEYKVIENLSQETQYTIRARLAEIYTEERTFITEKTENIPNGNLDSWSIEGSRKLKPEINPFASSQTYTAEKPESGWNTVNQKTFTGVTLGTWEFTVNAFPSTISVTNGNGKAALIRSIGWNQDGGNTTSGNSDRNSAGCLFLGTYSFDFNSYKNNYNWGIDFSSRPSSLKFDYMYTPYNKDMLKVWIVILNGATPIGTGEFIDGTTISNAYQSKEIKIEYNNNFYSKATSICIAFCSSSQFHEDDGIENDNMKNYIRYNNSCWEGSYLYVDNIELIYE